MLKAPVGIDGEGVRQLMTVMNSSGWYALLQAAVLHGLKCLEASDQLSLEV